ncbi:MULTISPECIES: hypothetical protein [Arsenophonus]|jgi:hypothetical protein|uniref:hypothetical protein n=1 Tax=Arsenophonus TaxID=637 RepID=UPI0015D8C733|nr:hypothetical protein [Arsenophonus endosymbiont of Apis mellifera]
MNNNFSKYKKIKNSLSYNYKNYPLSSIIAIDIASIVYKKIKFSFKDFIKIISYRKIKVENPSNPTIFYSIGNYKRRDYYEILDYVMKESNGKLIDLSNYEYKYYINLHSIFLSFYILFIKNRVIDLKWINKLHLFCHMVFCLNNIKALEKNQKKLNNIKSFCAFCSNLSGEAELDFFFKSRGIPTFTLQHGSYFLYSAPQPIDAIAYENLVADKLLCWGEYTKEQFEKYGIDKSRLLIAGYSKIHSPLKIKGSNEKLRILVLFSRKEFHLNNKKLFKLLKLIDQEYDIHYKLHPSLDRNEYKRLSEGSKIIAMENKTIFELLTTSNYDCTITYNSTAYYDSYINNCISLRYKDQDSDAAISVIDDNSFTNLKELKEKLQMITELNNDVEFWNLVSQRLTYILGFNINNYHELLK